MRKLQLRMIEVKILIVFYFARCVTNKMQKKHWIILERGHDARDNAYWFYKHVKEKNPDQKVYFIIDKRSADYHKVQEDAVRLGSIKSYFFLATAEKIISTHYGVGFPVFTTKLFRFLKLHKKFHFLQHGVTKDDLPMLYGQNAPMCTFICGAKPEYDYVKKVFGHPDGVVQYTGFARFDQLHDIKIKRQILVMPTWRSYIRDEKTFIDSDYYRYWQRFISNKSFIDTLENNNIRLVFYVHYEMQRFADHFHSESKNVVIAKFNGYDVQTLLKESALLITDFSSVFFDFAYMRKPVVYYQFDEKEFFGNHYKKGYFDYRTIGFGDVCTTEEDAVYSVMQVCNNDMKLDQKYMQRIKEFFPLYDKKNCERIYNIIAGDKNEK